MFLVKKSFGDGEYYRMSGEIVDGKGYRLLHKLINQGYLLSLNSKDVEKFKCKLCKRKFINEPTLNAHYIVHHPKEIEIVNVEDEVDEVEDVDT